MSDLVERLRDSAKHWVHEVDTRIPMRISELAVFCRVNRVLTPRRIERLARR